MAKNCKFAHVIVAIGMKEGRLRYETTIIIGKEMNFLELFKVGLKYKLIELCYKLSQDLTNMEPKKIELSCFRALVGAKKSIEFVHVIVATAHED